MASLINREFLDFSDILLVPQRAVVNSRDAVVLVTEFETRFSNQIISSIPIIISNMATTGTLEMANATEQYYILTAFHKYSENVKSKAQVPHFVSFGMSETIEEIGNKLEGTDHYIMLDVANGYIPAFATRCLDVRKAFPKRVIAAGNICTPEGMHALADSFVDIIKVGIGPGGHCRTREVAGVGIPQFTAIQDCALAASAYYPWNQKTGGKPEKRIRIIADGGIAEIGDFGKAFAAGADFVMAGSIFAQCMEAGSKDAFWSGSRLMRKVYGMASHEAHKAFGIEGKHSEGRVSEVEVTGPASEVIEEILGGLRSTISYCGCKRLDELSKSAEYIKVRNTQNRAYEKGTIGT